MLLAMEQSQENDVLKFPIQQKGELDNLPIWELLQQGKLAWANPINMAIAGTRKLTDKDKRALRRMNELSIKWGYAPLFDYDFENL